MITAGDIVKFSSDYFRLIFKIVSEIAYNLSRRMLIDTRLHSLHTLRLF